MGLAMADLFAKWSEVVKVLEEGGVSLASPVHALEGALSIRYGELLMKETKRHLHARANVECTRLGDRRPLPLHKP